MKLQYGLVAIIFTLSIPAYAEQADTETLEAPPASAAESSQQPMVTEQKTTEQKTTKQKPTEQTSEQLTDQAGFSSGIVTRAAITSAVENREPTDNLDTVNTELNQLYFFTELREMSGQTAKHRWEREGKLMAEVEFKVKGPRWRVWSSKSFVPGWTGDWKVSVINEVGEVISEKSFTYETAATAPENQSDTPKSPAIISVQ